MRFTNQPLRAVLLATSIVLLAAAPAGTKIINTATLSYQDSVGQRYSVESNAVTTTFAPVAALVVSPKVAQINPATDSFAAGQNVTRTFAIANASNIDDAYTIQTVSAAPAKVLSIAIVSAQGTLPVTLGTTTSPVLHPGDSIRVQVVLATTGVAIGTAFPISVVARTVVTGTTNGLQSDTGVQWAVAASAAQFTGTGPNSQVTKTVNHTASVQSAPGSSVTFEIQAKNSGGATATNVVLTDAIPNGLQADVTSVKIDGNAAGPAAALAGQTLTVKIPSLVAGAQLDVSFNATVGNASVAGATFTNVASITSDGATPILTTPASVLIGTADIVFDPATNNRPVGGATVALVDAGGAPVKLMPVAGQPGANAQNPTATGADGAYTFALEPSQIAAGGSRFYLTISAPGFLNRKIQLDIKLGTDGVLYDVTAAALDNQPLARAGGYTLTSDAVSLADVFGLFGNIPLFTARTVAVTKTVDKTVASPGDRLVYTVGVGNPSQTPLAQTILVDTLPAGEAYAPGTARLDGDPFEPVVAGRTLTWTLANVAAGANYTVTYATVVFPSVAPDTTLVNGVTASAAIAGTNVTATASATADVRIITSAFSQRGIITGRVFIDARRSERFAKGDDGVAGVRIFLEDGSSVVTDRFGRYSFAGVRPGMHVLRVDATTLPDTTRPFGRPRMGSVWSMQRLVHGLFDDGLMEDVNFGVEGVR